MTYRVDASRNPVSSRMIAGAALGSFLLLGGCASDINECVGPVSTVPALSGSQPQNTGAYPNLNVRPEVAAAQITPEQRAAAGANLGAAGHRAQAGAGGATMSAEEQARLKKLAEDKGANVLAEIEAQQ